MQICRRTLGALQCYTLSKFSIAPLTVEANKLAGVPPSYSRLEKWKGKELPGQTKGLYPFGCLAFKHVPAKLRTKLDEHASPAVYLGLDPNCRAYLLGSLYNLDLSTSVEVTFVENVFPFRKVKHRESPASLLWGTDNNMAEGDPRLGMFDSPDTTGVNQILDRHALKSIGALPGDDKVPATLPQCADQDFKQVPQSEAKVSVTHSTRRSSRVSKPPPSLTVCNQVPRHDYPEFGDNSRLRDFWNGV
jgi:hypothetical protein